MTEETIEHEESMVEKLLRERALVDDTLLRDHTSTLTIFFSDIKGYTTITESMGDIAGRIVVQRVNDIIIPAISTYHGHFIQTIGDAVMASFEDPCQAVRCSIHILQQLHQSNKGRPYGDQVHIRIGMHLGKVIMDKGNLFGDAVNTAARIEPQAVTDGILISATLYEAVRHCQEFECRFAKNATMKGKSEPVDLYQVVWSSGIVHDYGPAPSAPLTKMYLPQLSPTRVGWLAVIIAVVAVAFLQAKHSSLLTSSKSANHYEAGYAALKVRDLPRAVAQFQQISPDDKRQIETAAALKLWQKNPQAKGQVSEAMKKASERIYVHVMQGDILLQDGQTKEAAEEYRKGLVLSEGLDWHRAMAYNGLGRIQSAANQQEEALKSLAEAVRLSPDDAEILSNYGVLLERTGKGEAAAEYLNKAVQNRPEDTLARHLLTKLREEARLAADKARQERIDQLVLDLVTQYRDQSGIGEKSQNDPMPLRPPFPLWFVGLEEKGDLPAREGEKDVFLDLLGQELQQTGTVQLVERQMLERLLSELRLGSSALTDQGTALAIGRLVSARLLMSGTVFRKAGQTLIIIKIIETETSKIMHSLTFELNPGESLFAAAPRLAREMAGKLNAS